MQQWVAAFEKKFWAKFDVSFVVYYCNTPLTAIQQMYSSAFYKI